LQTSLLVDSKTTTRSHTSERANQGTTVQTNKQTCLE
jgi:hypothetical protein